MLISAFTFRRVAAKKLYFRGAYYENEQNGNHAGGHSAAGDCRLRE
jgi:hypothetical protein